MIFITIINLLLATILGGIIGYEREKKDMHAGFRTHILVCIGATLIQTISMRLFELGYSFDINRLGAQVISGIGFIGAGAIMKCSSSQTIRGLTTAASLWAVAAIGLTVGSRLYAEAIIATLFIIIALIPLKSMEDKFIKPKKRTKKN